MANVTDKVAIIRNATYGNEVREGIASGIENINTEVISTTAKQTAQEIAYNSLIINAGNSNAEIVDARLGEATLKAKLEKVDTSLADIAYLMEGLIDNETSPLFDNAVVINTLIQAQTKDIVITLPANKTFYIDSSLLINNKGIKLKGNNTILLFKKGIKAINVSISNFNIDGINIECADRDYSYDSIGLFIGKFDTTYKYTMGHVLKNCNFTDCTRSIVIESIYYIELYNITTIKDKIGLVINKISGASLNPATTVKLDRVYFKGSGDIFIPAVGSIGIEMFGIVNLLCSSVVSEWYETCGTFRTIQNATFTECYFELCTMGINFHTVSGNIIMINPYINSLDNYGIKIEYGSLVLLGGRSILTESQFVIEKGANSKLTILSKPQMSGGTFLKNNGFQNANIVNIDGGFSTSDTPINGFKAINQGYRETFYAFNKISTNLNTDPLNVTIGSNSILNFTTSGIEFNTNKYPIVNSNDGSKWKLTIGNDGVLVPVKIV